MKTNLLIYSFLSLLAISLAADNVTVIDSATDLDTADSYLNPTRRLPYTPWDYLPGTYSPDSYGGAPIGYDRPYDQKSIYYSYLASPAYASYNKNCKKSYTGKLILTKQALNAAFGYAINYLNKYKRGEMRAYQTGNYVKAPYKSATARHQGSSYINRRSPRYRKEMEALYMEAVSKYLTKYYCLNALQTNFLLPNMRILDVVKTGYVDAKCRYSYGLPTPKHESCANYGNLMRRSIDGTCNNLKHKYWGRSEVCHLSLLPKAYDDGISKPRTIGTSGYKLPPPREVANHAHHPWDSRAYYTNMKMQFGQWVNHDITNTPTVQSGYNGMIECCKNPYHPECLPIILGKGDYKSAYGKCMNFVRSTPCPLCVAGPRQQMNSITSYLDASGVYGSTYEQSHSLRTHKKGMLKFSKDKHGYMIMPRTKNPYADQCTGGVLCYHAGDVRANQHPTLGVVHTLWLRNHNRLALRLHKLYPNYSDERIYQITRAINIAQLQHITYKEYLPIVFGKDLMNFYSLNDNYGYSHYNPYTDPTSWNEYSTAACRFGHSQIPNWFSIVGGYGKNPRHCGARNSHYKRNGYYLRNAFFNARFQHDGLTDQLTLGLVCDRGMTSDPWIENDVRNYLYRDGKNPGLDLAAININRGRDHGFPGYTKYIQYCFNYEIKSWKQLENFIPRKQLSILKKIYNNYFDDIDLFTGMMSERKVVDGDIGPTSACVNGIQWHHLKYGDRFFYSHGYLPTSLSKAQLANIRQTTLSSIICKNTYIDKLQPAAFFPASSYNRLRSCRSYPDIDVKLFINHGGYK